MLPLTLTLDPIVPVRTASGGDRTLLYGYRLRLPDGPALGGDDPLLRVYGAAIAWLITTDEGEQALQDPRFEPGTWVDLMPDPFTDDDPDCVRVLDAGGVTEVGELPGGADTLASAGIEQGLGTRAFVLAERRSESDHSRVGLQVFVHAPALVAVDLESPPPFTRPERPTRRRVVLVADGSADIRWWDPSGDNGPGDLDELPISEDLAARLSRLRRAYADLAVRESADDLEPFEAMPLAWEREELDATARRLWQRARWELRRQYAVGFVAADMRSPVWSPAAPQSDDDVDIPF